MKPEYKTFEEQIFFSTLRIERPGAHSMGTGFLVEVPACIEGSRYVFLVSNRHVLDDPKKETRLSFHLKESADNVPELGKSFGINISEFKQGYYCSDSEDLALLNVSELVDLAKSHTTQEIYMRAVSLSMFSDFSESGLIPNKEIVFIGYPNNRYDIKNYLPILRGGRIASIPKVNYEGKSQVLVDAQVFPGSSGSPVFTQLGNEWKCIGVISQTMLRNQKVEIIEASQQLVTQDILGIGLVIKSTEILSLIKKAKEDLDKINCPTDKKGNQNGK